MYSKIKVHVEYTIFRILLNSLLQSYRNTSKLVIMLK